MKKVKKVLKKAGDANQYRPVFSEYSERHFGQHAGNCLLIAVTLTAGILFQAIWSIYSLLK